MNNIQIDFDVYKELTSRRETEQMTPNDVLRKVFALPPKPKDAVSPETLKKLDLSALNTSLLKGTDLICKGITFPHGTKFRALHKGQWHEGIAKDGQLYVNDTPFNSPSAAAIEVTRNNVNGWKFWECQFPGESEWKPISRLRSVRKVEIDDRPWT